MFQVAQLDIALKKGELLRGEICITILVLTNDRRRIELAETMDDLTFCTMNDNNPTRVVRILYKLNRVFKSRNKALRLLTCEIKFN